MSLLRKLAPDSFKEKARPVSDEILVYRYYEEATKLFMVARASIVIIMILLVVTITAGCLLTNFILNHPEIVGTYVGEWSKQFGVEYFQALLYQILYEMGVVR